MEVITYRQSIFLLSMILPVTGHFLLVPVMFTLSERDSWISILFTLPLGVLFAFVLYRLHTLHPQKTIIEMLELATGKIIGKILAISILGYFALMLVITLYGLFDFIYVIFLPETPRWFLALSFYVVVLYGVSIGIESITRMAEPLFLIVVITGVSIGIATHVDKNYENLLPVFENGMSHTLNGVFVTMALFGEFILLMMLFLKRDHKKSKSFFFTLVVTVILITWMFVSTVISSLAIFGLAHVNNLDFPAQSVVRIVSIGFLERFDVYGIFTIVLGSVIRMCTFQYILHKGIKQWLNVDNKWLIHMFITIVVLGYSFFVIENHREFVDIYLTKYYPLTAVVSVGIPLLVWIILEWKNQMQKATTKNNKSNTI